MTDKRTKVLVVGSANMDLVVRCERFPHPGETIFGSAFAMFPGGKGANQAVCCAKLGGVVDFLGRMGKDMFCERLSASMKRDGVCLDHLVIDSSEPTGTALITVDSTGQNEILVVSGSNMKLSPEDILAHRTVFADAAVVLVQLEIPIETVMQAAMLARENSALVVLNPAPACPLPENLFPMVDFITPNETEAELLTGIPVRDPDSAEQAARALLKRGVQNVIVTMGASGCLLVTPQQKRLFPAQRVQAVDTTAAGDAFNGSLAYALARQRTPEEAIPFANKVAAHSVTKLGAQSSMPTKKELEQFFPSALKLTPILDNL
jgi:ribokinase